MDNEERDIVVFTDEDNNEIELDVVKYFEHKGQEYAVLMDFNDSCDEHDECDDCCDCEAVMYIMKVVEDGEYEEFIPIDDDDLYEELIEVVEKELEEDEE